MKRDSAAARRWLIPACVATGLLLPSLALANGLSLYGAGSRATAMGGTGAANASDYSAVFYNPAAMVLGESSIGFEMLATVNGLSIRLADRPPGYDLPDLGPSSPVIPTDYRLRERVDPERPGSHVAGVVGATSTLGIDRLRLGVVAFLPFVTSGDGVSTFADEREQLFSNTLHWETIGAQSEHLVVMFSAAFEITDWLSLGAGLSYLPGTQLNNFVYVRDVADQSDIELNVGIAIPASFSPNFGILVQPSEDLRLGLGYRHSHSLRLQGQNEIQVRGLQEGGEFPTFQDLNIRMWSSPAQLTLGVAYDFNSLTLSLDNVFSFWANYRDNHDEETTLSNTLSSRLGAELRTSDTVSLLFGIAYEKSGVPEQTGRTNFVDNDRIVASAGTSHAFTFEESVLRIGWHAQFHGLIARSNVKDSFTSHPNCEAGVTVVCDEYSDELTDGRTGEVFAEAQGLQTGNPGFPGYSSGGWLGSFGVDITWEF